MRRLLVLGWTLCAGCAPTTARVTTTTVNSGMAALSDDANQAHLRAILDGLPLEEATRALAGALLDETRKNLSQEEWNQLVEQGAVRLVDALSPALAVSLQTEIGPALRAELVAGVRDALALMAQDRQRRQVGQIASTLTAAIVDTLTPRVQASVRALLREELAPLLEERLNAAVRGDDPLVRAASRQVMLGLGDALNGELGVAMHAFLAQERGLLMEQADDVSRRWERILSISLGAAGAGLVVAVAFLQQKIRQQRQSTEALTGVIRAIKRFEDNDEVQVLVEHVKETTKDTPGGKYLDNLIKSQPELNARKKPAAAPKV